MSKQTTALLAPTIILPLGITVPIIASKIFKGQPLNQFMTAYKLRVTLVPILDVMMLHAVKSFHDATDLRSNALFWAAVVSSTALFSIVDSMQFNSQMIFFASRVDPAIGGKLILENEAIMNTLIFIQVFSPFYFVSRNVHDTAKHSSKLGRNMASVSDHVFGWSVDSVTYMCRR